MTMVALGITAGAAALTAGVGAYTAIDARKKQSSAQRKLEEQARNSPLYKRDKSIDDYYQQSLNQFLQKPTDSLRYQLGGMNARRATAQGISALQDRRAAIGGIDKLALGQNSAMDNLAAQAEATKFQNLRQWGSAANMKNQEGQREYDFNKLTPFNRQIGLGQMEASAAGDRYNAGMQMVGQGISAAGQAAGAYAKYKGVSKD